MHLSALVSIEQELLPALQGLQKALEEKAEEFMPVIKTGRTHLQDATPIRLGQEFLGYAGQIERGIAVCVTLRVNCPKLLSVERQLVLG